jgi:hypothetical protein
MKAIITRLRRLEQAVPPEDPEKFAQLDAILQGLKEARGEPFDDAPVDYTGCHTIADMILARFNGPERERAKNAAVSGGVGTCGH